MNNSRKEKVPFTLWLTEAEMISLNALLQGKIKNEYFEENIAEIIETANKRGDLERR